MFTGVFKSEGVLSGNTTNYFGSITRSAVTDWQHANGITPASGYFGPLSISRYRQDTGQRTEVSADTTNLNSESGDSKIDTDSFRTQLQQQVRELMRQLVGLLQQKLAQTLDRAGIDRSQFADALGTRVAVRANDGDSSSSRNSSNRSTRSTVSKDNDSSSNDGGGGGAGSSEDSSSDVDSSNTSSSDSSSSNEEEVIYLVNNGAANADIVISNNAPNMVSLAAEYFQNDIRDMTGATLSIRNTPGEDYDFHVYVGESQYTDDLGVTSEGTRYDGYKIVSGDDYLVMLGDDEPYDVSVEMSESEWDAHTAPDVWGNSQSAWRQENRDHDVYSRDGRGSINAIHNWLEGQGMRYYYPDHFGTITPEKNSIQVKQVNKIVNPAFAMRAPYHYYKRFRHLSNQGLFLDNGDFGTRHEWLRFILSLGINHEQKVIIGQTAHGLNQVTNRDETRQAHPEYFATWSGELMNTGHKPKQNLCSDELKAATVRYISTMYDTYGHLYPNDKYVSIWPADGFTRVSEHSEECRAMATPEYGGDGRISDYVWNFTNDIAWEIYDEYGEEHYVMGGAYSAYKLPPRNITNPRGWAPNIAVMISHNRITTANPTQEAYREQLVTDWDELAPGQVFMNDKYLYNKVGATGQSVPHFFPQIISDDFKMLDERVNGEFDEVATNLPWRDSDHDAYAATGLNMYITSKLFWDPQLNIEPVLEEYYNLYYGPAGETMEELVDYSEDNLVNNFVTNPMHLNSMRDIAEDAKGQVPNGSEYEERIDALLGMMNSVYQGDETVVQQCQELNSPGTTYVLDQPVSSNEQCFFINQNGITLDCKGFTISSDEDAVHISARQSNRGHYYTIKNCDINSQNGHGIYAGNADHGLIENNNIEARSRGMWVTASEDVTIKDNYVYSAAGAGAYIQVGGTGGSDAITQHTINNNVFETDSGTAAAFYNSDGDNITDNEFITDSGYAVRMYNPENTVFADNILRAGSGSHWLLSNPISLTRENNQEIDNGAVQGARTTRSFIQRQLDTARDQLQKLLNTLLIR